MEIFYLICGRIIYIMNFEIKINDKLSLKLRHEDDAEKVFLLTDKNRKELRKWLPWVDSTSSPEDSKKYILQQLEKFKNKTAADFGVYYETALVGSMGFNEINLIDEWAEIGYWLDGDYVGKGIMTDCVKAMITYGFNELDLHRIQIRCDSINVRSKAIPERLGFTLEGVVREYYKHEDGTFSDSLIYGLLRNEWVLK